MKIAEGIYFPIKSLALWQTPLEQQQFAKKVKAAKAKERRVVKAGLILCSTERKVMGDTEYEFRFYRDIPACEKFANDVLQALLAGRITLGKAGQQ